MTDSYRDPRPLPPPRETMKVVVNGKEEERFVDHIEVPDSRNGDWPFPVSMTAIGARRIPELFVGEFIEWMVGDARPHIFEGQHD